ncbi:MAG: hypothetical protein EHM43_10110 [Ignavibacteriae bacterium]|nr:MAG: hypothetical protein EHM43_10110 [Ignavibacteriota bacterium]
MGHAFSLSAQTQIPPQQREGSGHRKAAEAFFESLHVVPPGLNWRVVNEAVREARVMRTMKRAEGVQADTPRVRGTWREIGSSNQAGRVVAVKYDEAKETIYAAGAGGTVWKGKSDGSEWTCLTDAKRINDPVLLEHVVLPDGNDRVIALSANARCFTLDEPNIAWQQAEGLTEMQRWGWFSKAVSCQREGRLEIIAAGTEWDYGTAWKARGVIYRSVDSGRSFQRLKWIDGTRTVWTDGAEDVWIVHGDTLSALHADGSLSMISTSMQWNGNGIGTVIMGGPWASYVGMAVTYNEFTTFLMTEDDGRTWNVRGSIKVTPFDAQSFDIDGSSVTWMFGGVEVHRSLDEGRSWSVINKWGEYYGDPAGKLHADIPAINHVPMSDGTSSTFISTDGGLYITKDGGGTVRNLSLKGLNISQYYSSYTSRDNVDVVTVGSQDQGYQRSRVDSGGVRAFQQMISGDYSSLVSGDGGRSLFCVYPGFTMYVPRAEDGWGPHMLDFPHKGHMWLPPLASSPTDPEQTWLGGGTMSTGARVYTYTFAQVKLEIDSLDHDFGEGQNGVNITALTFAPSNDQIAYVVASQGVVWRTPDHGATWTKHARPDKLTGHYFSGNALVVDPREPYRVYIGGSGYDGPAVFVSNDGAQTWDSLVGLPPCLVLSLAVSADGRYIGAATDAGAFMYDTLHKSWTDITELGAPDQNYWHVDYVTPLDIFRFSTYGRGIQDFTVSPTTSVSSAARVCQGVGLRVGLRVGQGVGLEVVADREVMANVVWYSIDGRKIYEHPIHLVEGTTRFNKPAEASGAETVVIITDDGHVAAGVTPR